MTTGANVLIGGRPMAVGWDGSDLVAVAGLSIRWGRALPYDDPEPSVLKLQLVDRRGTFVSDPNRIGQEVVVQIANPQRAVFRGTITDPEATRARIHNPLLNTDETVWIVTLTATDPLAALNMAIYPGDASDGTVEGAGGWLEVNPNNRLSALFAAGASGVIAGFEPVPDIVASPPIYRRLHGQLAKDSRTALELVQQAYRGVPLGVANYDPSTDLVSLGKFASSSPVALVLTTGKIKLNLPGGWIVPASKVGADAYTLKSSVSAAIDAVQVSYYWYGKDPTLTAGAQKRTIYTQGFIEGRTTRYNPRTRRVLKVDTEFITFDPTEFGGDVSGWNRFPAWLRDQVLGIVNKLNGQLEMPRLRFDARRMPLPQALEDALYTPTVQAVPMYFAGSVFNGIDGAGPQFQIIGGTLSYDRGWRHDVTVCATGPNGPGLTIGQLVTNPTPTLGDYDPDISLADLGLVTIGLA